MSATFWKVFELTTSAGVLYGFHAAAAERKTGEIFMVVRGAGRNDFSGAGKVSGDL